VSTNPFVCSILALTEQKFGADLKQYLRNIMTFSNWVTLGHRCTCVSQIWLTATVIDRFGDMSVTTPV